MNRNEKRFVSAAAVGDPAAFGMLVEEHTPRLQARITRKLGSREAAEDVLQEAFVAAFQRLETLRDPESFGAWLCSIADNKVRMWHRRRLAQLDLLERFGAVPRDEPEEQQII